MAAVSRTRVNFQDQNSVRGYIESLLFSAGECLRAQGVAAAQLNRQAFDQARPQMPVESRPIVLHLFEIIDHGNVGWFGSKKITLFKNLINIKWPSGAPKNGEKLSKADEEKRKKENEAFWNSLIGSVVAVAAAVLTGFTYDNYAIQRKTLRMTTGVSYGCVLEGPLHNNFLSLVEHQLNIDELNDSKATHYFCASIVVLIGGIGWGLGGFMSAPGLSTVGKMAVAAAGIWGGVNLGRHWNDNRKINAECVQINAWAQSILYYDMPLYNPDMSYRLAVQHVPADAPPPSFVPDASYPDRSLYPGLLSADLRPQTYCLPSIDRVD
ncbi:MAG TPA: hypothetical protein VMR37_04920 [Rhabdochlamydiaceae bacterium]|nr:hypothetical protein [Rhabdochlamydiaceae bacterium]